MALLQISEPGMSTAPHQHRLAVGIDLGTTNSLVATVRNGISIVLNDEDGHTLLPSVVHYAEDNIRVGYDAQSVQSKDPHNTIVSVKRFMGRSLSDLKDHVRLPYHFIDTPAMVQIKTRAGVKSPVQISAEILKSLRQRAEKSLGGELVGAVITVPAYFDDAQRQATKDAARLAGVTVLRLLNEPTAAAIAYGLDNASEGIYAVFDLGGGTFDISILRLQRGVFEVLSTNGDSALGGDDFDQRIFCWIAEQGSLSALGARDTRLLLTKAREAKEALSDRAEVRITAALTSGEVVDLTLTAKIFTEITRTLVNKTLAPTRKALRDAELNADDVKGVVMVGGSTRLPQIQRAVSEFFGPRVLNNLDPDKVVALGAAIQANMLAGNRVDEALLLLDVIPLSLGIETMGGLVEKIIPRNSTIPIAKAQDFTTYKDGQSALSCHVVQGERELAEDCRSLAKFELRGIPAMVAGAARIRVTFQVDADGLLSVSAREESTGTEAAITVKPAYGLSDGEITRMLEDSNLHAGEDAASRALREALVEGQRMIDATNAALVEDADLLEPVERQHIDAELHALQLAMTTTYDHRAVRAAINRVNKITESFAGRRMDRGVSRALTGKTLGKLDI